MRAVGKPLLWLHGAVRTPPRSRAARLEAGWSLRRLQLGESLGLPHSRPLPVVGAGCHELRIVDRDTTWRIVYRVDDAEIGRRGLQAQTPRLRRALRREGVRTMEEAKRKRRAEAGWRSGDAADFIGLTAEEAAFVELKLALARHLRDLRTRLSLTQGDVAGRLGSSQSRVAKMEAADASVSVDLLVRGLLALGATPEEIGRVIAQAA